MQKPTLLRETPANNIFYSPPPEPTFLEHIYELRRRLFWVVGAILLGATLAYPIHPQLIALLSAPLGDQQLYYLTPIGGFAFIFKLCTYVGIVVAIPVIMYHIYRYLEPLMAARRRPVAFYISFSFTCAVAGMLFAYYVTLPGALHFLTGFNIEHIKAMLTVDSYLSFVTTYLLGAALLFQIPVIMLIINTIKPIPPRKMMGAQRYVIVAAVLAGAILSPTPDVTNQFFFALPIVVMYEVGVLVIWLQQRMQKKQHHAFAANVQLARAAADIPDEVLQELSLAQHAPKLRGMQTSASRPLVTAAQPKKAVESFNIATPQPRLAAYKPAVAKESPAAAALAPATPRGARQLTVPRRSAVDGFAPYPARS